MGHRRVQGEPDYVRGACEIASRQTQETMSEIIQQISTRATAILMKQADFVELLWFRKNGGKLGASTSYFGHLKDLYQLQVTHHQQRFLKWSRDLFYDARTIYWNWTTNAKKPPSDKVKLLAGQIFKDQVERISRACLLGVCQYFVFPM